jgi:hypothetical protein
MGNWSTGSGVHTATRRVKAPTTMSVSRRRRKPKRPLYIQLEFDSSSRSSHMQSYRYARGRISKKAIRLTWIFRGLFHVNATGRDASIMASFPPSSIRCKPHDKAVQRLTRSQKQACKPIHSLFPWQTRGLQHEVDQNVPRTNRFWTRTRSRDGEKRAYCFRFYFDFIPRRQDPQSGC